MRQKSNVRFDFRKRIAYYAEAKRLFHINAQRQLKQLAAALGLEPGGYNLRSNKGEIAVSGEVTLHADGSMCRRASRQRAPTPASCSAAVRAAATMSAAPIFRAARPAA